MTVTEDVGTITATWTDPLGEVWQLSDTSDDVGWFTTPGPSGWGATTYEIVSDPLPRGGESIRFIRAKPGVITWPLYIFGDTHLQYVQRWREVKKAFLMTVHRGLTGVLRVARPDGSAREIDCMYQAGLEGPAGEAWLWSKEAITLFCPDGYWRDIDPIVLEHEYQPGVDFQAPFPQVSPGLSLGDNQLDNPGDVTAWPEWTITGPMEAITAVNNTTGYEFTLSYSLGAGEQITIVTDRPQVRGPAGQNLVTALNWPAAYLWWLDPGVNSVSFNVSGADVGTSVTLQFHARYDGA